MCFYIFYAHEKTKKKIESIYHVKGEKLEPFSGKNLHEKTKKKIPRIFLGIFMEILT